MADSSATYTYEAFIRTTPEQLWRAITDSEFTSKYFYGSPVETGMKVGDDFVYLTPDRAGRMGEGRIVDVEPGKRLVLDEYRLLYEPEVAGDRPSRETWEIEPAGPVCKLRFVHDQLVADGPTHRAMVGGIPLIISSLKSLLETGEPLPMEG